MKQQYIKQVKKELAVTRNQKKEVMRDLDEVFSSALEHGESENEVIERLGTPTEFVSNFNEQTEVQNTVKKKRTVSIGIALVISIVSFVLYGIIQLQQPPNGAIGHADAMTNIRVESISAIDIPQAILIIGIIASIFTFYLIIRMVYKNKK